MKARALESPQEPVALLASLLTAVLMVKAWSAMVSLQAFAASPAAASVPMPHRTPQRYKEDECKPATYTNVILAPSQMRLNYCWGAK
jgi:hypothetical protein